MCRVISFPKRADGKPEFAWLDVTDDGEDDENGPSVVVDPHPLMNDIAHREVAFNENKILGVKLDTHINLCYDDDFVYNYDHENAAIHSATNGKCHIKWKGPMFAYGGERNESENMEKIVDMDMNSYADIVAWLINYRNDSAAHRFRKGPKVKGVRMRCDGGSAAERMEFAMVPRMHPIFDNGEFSEISQKMGFPLRFRKDVTKKAAEPDDPKQSNSTLTSMMRSCNIKDENKFGLPLPHWQAGQTSDTLVVRADGQHMDPENWEFFGHYCEKVLQPGFRRAAEELDQNGDFLTAAESVLDSISAVNNQSHQSTGGGEIGARFPHGL
ncbi:unnamed protein product [Zymoseptoria tritici ST99CH_3D1]|nr:unnamed protein product [Zymoseptoria tritici ST99CH_3D1]